MNQHTLIGKLLCWFSIAALIIPAFITSSVEYAEDLPGIVLKNSWIFYLIAPIPILSIIYSYRLKKIGYKFKKIES